MRLEKNGTATLEINGEEVVLRSPTWAELKKLRRDSIEIQKNGAKMVDAWRASATMKLSEMSRKWLEAAMEGKNPPKDWENKLRNLPEDEQALIYEIVNDIQVVLPEATGELVTAWWVDTIELLGGVTVESSELAANFSRPESIDRYLMHVVSVPFDSGP